MVTCRIPKEWSSLGTCQGRLRYTLWHDMMGVTLYNLPEYFREVWTVVLVDWVVSVDILDFFRCGV